MRNRDLLIFIEMKNKGIKIGAFDEYGGYIFDLYYLMTPSYPLHYAKKQRVYEWLLNNKANVNELDTYGRTALFYSDLDKAKTLIKYGVNTYIKDIYGRDALFYADENLKDFLINHMK